MPETRSCTVVEDALVERFLRYSAISSQSDASATLVPSSPGQRELAELLADELRQAGALDVHLSSSSVLTARIPACLPEGQLRGDAIGFCAHLDTVDVDLSPVVKAHVVSHDGGDVCLDPDRDLWLRADEHPELAQHVGDRLLVADGTSVLGADDKAAIAVLMEAALELLSHPDPVALPHGDVHLAFVPDEEIGLRGVQTLELERFPVARAWTIDCCELGEVAWETFNAASATVRIAGVSAHPMSAKGVMVNPVLVAHDLVGHFDRTQTPECTEGREGYVWVQRVEANASTAVVELNIRDHDLACFEQRKRDVRDAVDWLRAQHPRASVELELSDTYGNIADALGSDRRAVDDLLASLADLGIEPLPIAMRGGTDGSWLSGQGIATPNFFTGAHNFHSAAEFLPLHAFERSLAVVRGLVRRSAS